MHRAKRKRANSKLAYLALERVCSTKPRNDNAASRVAKCRVAYIAAQTIDELER